MRTQEGLKVLNFLLEYSNEISKLVVLFSLGWNNLSIYSVKEKPLLSKWLKKEKIFLKLVKDLDQIYSLLGTQQVEFKI